MKLATTLFSVSVAANVLLGWWLCRPGEKTRSESAGSVASIPEDNAPRRTAASAGSGVAESPSSVRPTPAETRDQLRALGLPENVVRAAVRAQVEAPRRAQQRALAGGAAKRSWWHVASIDSTATGEQLRELRQFRTAERTELTRLFGPIGSVTREEMEPYVFLPEEKAARVAALRRDILELRDEIQADGVAPTTGADARERRRLLMAEWNREVAALLTPAEFEEHELRTSISASAVGHYAKYFPGTADEFRALYERDKAWRAVEAETERDPNSQARFEAQRVAHEKMNRDLESELGAERYALWKRTMQTEYQALAELQRRYPQPAGTIAALEALPRQISEQAMVIARDNTLPADQKLAKLREFADESRARVRAILGPDLGDAYNEVSARGWLDHLEQGRIPMYQPNGERGIFLAVRPEELRRVTAPMPSPAPKRP